MRAWVLHETSGPSSYRLEQLPTPEPGPKQARVKLLASGLNHLDLWVSMGLPRPSHFPHISGADGAGVIDALGEGTSGWSRGDEVIVDPSMSCGICAACRLGQTVFCKSYAILGEHTDGTLAEFVVVPTTNLRRKATSLTWEAAGSFGLVTGTAYRMLDRAGLRSGEVMLVVGVGGGVSSMAALLGLAFGAAVYVTSRSEAKIAWAMNRGASGGFDSASDYSKQLKQDLGRGADVVIDNVGAATWEHSVRSLDPGGRLAVCGGTAGSKVDLSLPYLFFKQIELIGSTMYTPTEFSRALHLVETNAVEVPVDSVCSFEDLPSALDRLASGDQLGKIAMKH